MKTSSTAMDLEKAKVNLETSLIAWHELQRFFAAGLAIAVDNSLDMIEVAYHLSIDDAAQVQDWLNQQLIGAVSDGQALAWYEQQAEVWAVVVKPWVLVQAQAA